MARGKSLDKETRIRIVEAHNRGSSTVQIAQILLLKRTTVVGILKRYVETGEIEKKIREANTLKKLNEVQTLQIRMWVDEDCTTSLQQLANRCLSEFQVPVCKSTINNILGDFSYTLKRLHLIPERRNTPTTIESRYQYAIDYINLSSRFSENEVIFIDEVGFNVSMRTGRGRSMVGTPATLSIPALRSRNISICCAISRQGIILYESKLSAYNSSSYSLYLNNLINILIGKNLPNVVFIMDNVRFHKTQETMNTLENANITYMYLPPYSPFLNPIENMFSKWKDYVKRGNPINENSLMALIANGSNLISSSDTEGYYRNMSAYISRCLNREEILD